MTEIPKARDLSPADDELRLSILRRYHRGDSVATISNDLGLTRSFASVVIQRIRDADLAESGEPAEVVMAAYPKRVRAAKVTA